MISVNSDDGDQCGVQLKDQRFENPHELARESYLNESAQSPDALAAPPAIFPTAIFLRRRVRR